MGFLVRGILLKLGVLGNANTLSQNFFFWWPALQARSTRYAHPRTPVTLHMDQTVHYPPIRNLSWMVNSLFETVIQTRPRFGTAVVLSPTVTPKK